MASVAKRADGRWRARYRDASGRERARHFVRKVDAQAWLDSVTASVVRGDYVDPVAGRRTFADYAAEWASVQVHRPTTRAQVETHLRRHVLPVFGDRPLASVRPSEVQAWVRGRTDVLEPSTVQVVYRFVSAIFKAAVADRLIPSSPCVGVRLPKVEPRQVRPLATEAVERLAAAVPAPYRALVVLAAGTGVRQGEAFGLEVRHVDFLRRQLRVEQQLVLLPGGPPVVGPPKTQASYRTIPLPQVVLDELAAHLVAFPVGPSGLLFTTDSGEPIRRTAFSRAVWTRAVRAAGLPTGTGFHDLRHFYASLLIRHGESVKVVQARLGHASAAETLDTYSHLWPDSEDRTREAVDLVLGALADCVRTAEAL